MSNSKRIEEEFANHHEQTKQMDEYLKTKIPHPSDDLQLLVRDMTEAEQAVRRAMRRTSADMSLQVTLGYILDDLSLALQGYDPGDDD